jgi:hypothetical protein
MPMALIVQGINHCRYVKIQPIQRIGTLTLVVPVYLVPVEVRSLPAVSGVCIRTVSAGA